MTDSALTSKPTSKPLVDVHTYGATTTLRASLVAVIGRWAEAHRTGKDQHDAGQALTDALDPIFGRLDFLERESAAFLSRSETPVDVPTQSPRSVCSCATDPDSACSDFCPCTSKLCYRCGAKSPAAVLQRAPEGSK